MNVAIVILTYLVTLCLNIVALRRIDFRRLLFIDGVVLGLTYYIMIPMAVILMSGRIGSDFLKTSDYLPYEDLDTTVVILVGAAVVCLAKLGLDLGAKLVRLSGPSRPISGDSPTQSHTGYTLYLVVALVVLDLGSSSAFFIASGVSNGAHWYHASSDLMATSPLFLMLKHLGNFSRTAVFGAIAVLANLRPRLTLRLVMLGAILAVADLFLTFNRITIVYFLLLLLMVSWRRIYLATAALGSLLFSGTYLSSIWPEFRGQVSNFGYSFDGMSQALAKAIEVVDTSKPFVDQMNGMFESFSFAVLNWIVHNRASLNVPTGSYFVRPLTVLIPRSMWSTRPESFATALGSHFSETELALNSYLFGEPFAESWLFWPLLLLFVIFIYDISFRGMARSNPAWGGVGALIGFAWWRFDSSFPAVSLILTFLLYIAFSIVAPRRRSRRGLKGREGGAP